LVSYSNHFCIKISKWQITRIDYLRVIEDINWYLLPIWPKCFLDVEGPQKSSNRNECTLLSESLTTAHPSAPTKGHVSSLVWERAILRIFLKVPIRVETIRFWEFPVIVVDCPNISLDPCTFWNQVTLNMVRRIRKETSRAHLVYIILDGRVWLTTNNCNRSPSEHLLHERLNVRQIWLIVHRWTPIWAYNAIQFFPCFWKDLWESTASKNKCD
jgi:hypothetical protein